MGEPEPEVVEHGSAEDYPFDPNLDPSERHAVSGLEKLRYFSDRDLAESLYVVYMGAHANDTDPVRVAERRKQEALKQRRRLHELSKFAEEAFGGRQGPLAKSLAYEYLVDDTQRGNPRRADIKSLETYYAEFLRQEKRQ